MKRALLVLASLLLACAAPVSTTPDAGIGFSGLFSVAIAKECSLTLRCCAGTPFPDEPTCVSAYTSSTYSTLGALVDSIDAGRMDYDHTLAEKCAAAVQRADCDSGFTLRSFAAGPDCAGVILGKGEDGDACTSDFDCNFLLHCAGTELVATGSGTCAARGSTGSLCSFSSSCQIGLHCVYGADGGLCGPITAVDGGPCDTGHDCPSGLQCAHGRCASVTLCQ